MRDLRELQAVTDQELILKVLQKYNEKSENVDLKAMTSAFIRVCSYVAGLEIERQCADRIITESNMNLHRAILRAQRSETKIEELESELKVLKNKIAVFGLD